MNDPHDNWPYDKVETTASNMSKDINELATALSKAQGEMGLAEKSSDNPFFKSKYADLASVIEAARPALHKHGLAVTQLPTGNNENVALTTMLTHSSGQWISCTMTARPNKPDVQGVGSVISYLRRYSFSAIVCQAAGTPDDDGNKAVESSFDAGMKDNYLLSIVSAYKVKDEMLGAQLWRELGRAQQMELWGDFNSHQKSWIRAANQKAVEADKTEVNDNEKTT